MAIWTLFVMLSYAISSTILSNAMTINNKIIRPSAAFPLSFIQPEQMKPSLPTRTTTKLYKESYFTQTLDHFNYNPNSYQTLQQRYLINDKYWGGPKTKSPIFVYTGNEDDIEWIAENTGFMFDMAPHFKALLVFIEHRYYGKSMPYGGSKETAYSNSTTLGYLSSTQALADYATLILDLKKNLTAMDCPVVVFGGSYGGMLAAWFRLKYPHVAIGALASSAPILSFGNITSPYSFNNIITQDFRSESESCYRVIKRSWQEIEEVAAKPGGLKILRNSFRICKNFRNASYLERWLEDAYVYAAMKDYPTPSNSLPAYPVKQACTEMILITEGKTKDSIFPAYNYSYNDRLESCKKFKIDVEPRPSWVPIEFGGEHIHRVLKRFASNIIFFNGLRDPWSYGGVLKDISESVVAIVAKQGAHHVDLRFSTSKDPEWLQSIREREVDIISTWLSQYYCDLAIS